MTEEQIIKGLNDTVGKEHIGIYCTDKNGNFTTVIKLTDIVELINRKNAEMEKALATIDGLINGQETLQKYIAEKDAEIERLKEAIISKNLTPTACKVMKENDEKHIHIVNGLKAELEQKDIEIKLLIEKKEAAYDEISRLNAVLERLQGINEILESAFAAECDLSACPRKKEIRDEAIKEFLDRAKKRIGDSRFQNYGLAIMEIMDVAKEMVGELE